MIVVRATRTNPALDVSFDDYEVERCEELGRVSREIQRSESGAVTLLDTTDPDLKTFSVSIWLRYPDTITNLQSMASGEPFQFFPRYNLDSDYQQRVIFANPAQVLDMDFAGYQRALRTITFELTARVTGYIMIPRHRIHVA